jgi:Na+/H+ antiporter NhaD/arsenite permease-like protein
LRYNRAAMSPKPRSKRLPFSLILLVIFAFLFVQTGFAEGDAQTSEELVLSVLGRAVDSQHEPVAQADVRAYISGVQQDLMVSGEVVSVAQTDSEGFYVLDLLVTPAEIDQDAVALEISKEGYLSSRQGFARREIVQMGEMQVIRIPDVVLARVFNPAFFLATGIFIVVFGMISLNLLHETIAAFFGVAAVFAISYFIGSSNSDFWIIGFRDAVSHIDFDVIFLLMTMMIFMAVMGQTGVFQWMAYQTFRLARGNALVVTLILVAITGVTSSMLNDVTVMLLMAPVSIQIALSLDINPAAIVVPEILASNIGGAATLIGNPPNTIIGSYVGLSFNQFLVAMLPIALIGMVILLVMIRWLYRSEFERTHEPPSEALMARLEEGARITNPKLLRKSLILFGLTLILFFVADLFHMPPAAVAILGSTALLLWTRPTMGEMLREVDWTTLVFFMSLFMMVGAIQEVGLIQLMAEWVSQFAGGNLLLATLVIIWVSAIASAIVANIPFAAAFVPVAVFLTQSLPGAENNVLYWALALGTCLGGNATYIGAAPNVVAAGILDRAGYRISFKDFSRVGVPVTFVTILIPTIWIIIRYFWIGF